MIRKFSILFVFVVLLLSACSSDTFSLSGDSENWSAVLEVLEQRDYQSKKLELQYKGNDVDAVGEFTYSVETNAGGFSGSGVTLNEAGILAVESESNPTNAKVMEDSEAEVVIEWNGNSETIILN